MAVNLMINIDDDIYTRLHDNGTEDFDVTEEDLRKILRSVRKGVPFVIGIDVAHKEE